MTSELTMQTRQADGLAIRYAETDAHDEPTLLLLSPWPESEGLLPQIHTPVEIINGDHDSMVPLGGDV